MLMIVDKMIFPGVIDIVSLVNFILSEGSVNNENLCLYDLTEDDTINVDIVFLVNLLNIRVLFCR